jgi:hypothetical protein
MQVVSLLTPENVFATLAILSVLWAAMRWIFTPHVKKAIASTINDTVGEQLKEVPTLTRAVEKLSAVIDRQSNDTERLTSSMDGLSGKVEALSEGFADLRERTATLEGAKGIRTNRGRRKSQGER